MTLELIRKAARKIFYSKSFEDVSLDEIAAEAGVSRGTIYLHFPGKNDILLDLLSEDLAAQMAIYEELAAARSEEHTSELQSLMRISYAVFCLKKKKS